MARRGFGAWMLIGGVGFVGWWLWRQYGRMDLTDRTVLITGGSRGLGLVLARDFAAAGARVAICARDPVELERAEFDLLRRGATVMSVTCDVTQAAEVLALVATVHARFGPIDVLVNNAGMIQVGPVETLTIDDFDASLAIHVMAPLYTILAVLPDMQARRAGRIVNIASIGGKVSVPHLLAYSTGKFALTGLSEGLRAELAKDAIQVTTVIPGLMRTGSPRQALFKGQHQLEAAWFTVMDSLPLTSMSAERAARQIVRATVHGDAEVILSAPAKVAALFHGLFPGLTSDLLGLVNAWLPGPGDTGHDQVKGRDSGSALTESWLTWLTRQAARQNNEMAG
ncbi:MAG: SDR family NAD(P)-dependent oxidoreductase [Candidatus Sericytochromatia bacterium]|nr:SDR family NAD(P)-dependent oxidoreductase [Candidatus Sericytochromatia bacterium]